MAEHGPHCETCTCGCTCGYGGQHEPDKESCELNRQQQDIIGYERKLADDLATVLDDPTFAPEWFARRNQVLARYRQARP